MPKNVVIPLFKHGQDLTGQPTAAVVGGTFAKYVPGGRAAQPKIATAGAGEYPAGVVGHDQEADGFVHILVGGVVPVTAGEDLIVNDRVQVGADGKAVKLTDGIPVGIATANAATGGAAFIRLSI
ncbi:hypothetical protein ACMX2H_17540 [Arthrobacter sulfonylureivorans]|uniref:hypothetical protein n=1 Tax=Arthrobacter sulfonylureivorans TaxID=2486855 RepID=UPI0039E35CA5